MFVFEFLPIAAADHNLDIVDISRLDICVLCLRFHMLDLPGYLFMLSAHHISLASVLTTIQPSSRSGAMVHGAAPRCISQNQFLLLPSRCKLPVSCLIRENGLNGPRLPQFMDFLSRL